MPPLFRYIEQTYIDEFFDTGQLRLGAFAAFAKHEDEQRLDAEEGWGTLSIAGKTGRGMLQMTVGIGREWHVLSCSLRESPDLMRAFRVDGYFRINKSTGFLHAIADALPDARDGFEGRCVYQGRRFIARELEYFSSSDLRTAEGKHDTAYVTSLVSQVGFPALLFLKANQYASQEEYRLLWRGSANEVDAVHVVAPDAVRYCSKIT